jgi:hypothetical protein
VSRTRGTFSTRCASQQTIFRYSRNALKINDLSEPTCDKSILRGGFQSSRVGCGRTQFKTVVTENKHLYSRRVDAHKLGVNTAVFHVQKLKQVFQEISDDQFILAACKSVERGGDLSFIGMQALRT